MKEGINAFIKKDVITMFILHYKYEKGSENQKSCRMNTRDQSIDVSLGETKDSISHIFLP